MKQEEVKVSILCLAYNHGKMIRACLDGFVHQKTDFCFQVIIHDDASKDDTADIIREYVAQYPDIFVPILQEENQFSLGKSVFRTYLFPLVHSKYVAVCEGDDFWTDNTKLQKQYDFMEANPEYSACVHNAVLHNMSDERLDYVFPDVKEDRDYSIEEIIMGDGGLFSTNSLFAKSEILTQMPDVFLAKGFTDYQWFMNAAFNGKVRCLKDVMSQYNYGTAGSWSQSFNEDNSHKLAIFKAKVDMLMRVDAYYHEAYHDIIMKKVYETLFYIYYYEKNYKELNKAPYNKMWKKRLALFIKTKMTWLYKILKFFKDKLKK